jgi:hypothetical protein
MFTRPVILLRVEEAILLAAAIFAYQRLHYSWPFFAILFLAPDLFMVGYLANPRFGAALYNLVHTLSLPSLSCSPAICSTGLSPPRSPSSGSHT